MPGEFTCSRGGANGEAAQRGQTMAEYVIVLAVITIAIILGFATMAGAIQAGYENATSLVGSAG